jgi:glutamyl-Q tRNA(Asp) synthetase
MPWFLRIEDIDPPREQPGAVARIKQQCDSHGLAWDTWPETKGGRADGVLYQSDRTDPAGPYAKALQQLVEKAMAFRCQCSRSVLQQVFAASRAEETWSTDLASEDDPATTSNRPYPGLCRNKKLSQGRAWRFRSPEVREGLGEDDFILQRADGLWAYHLAVVVDDQWQGITRIVRGEDLQPMQSRHQWLQEALGLARPDYLHVPVVTNAMGQKLSKQTQAEALRTDEASVRKQLAQATEHLRKTMPLAWLDQVSPAAKAMGLRWS